MKSLKYKIRKIKKLKRLRKRLAYCRNKICYAQNPRKHLIKTFIKDLGYVPNLDNPQTYNEKLLWLRLFWYDPVAEICADKYDVRKFIENKGYGEYLNEIYGVWERCEDIDFNKLPDEFVLKSTHGSGDVIVCRDKAQLDKKKVLKDLKEWISYNYFYIHFEWVYKNLKPRIVCERLIKTEDGFPPTDYKVFCFNGEPKIVFTVTSRGEGTTKMDFYTCDWELLPFKRHYPNSDKKVPRPPELDRLLEISKSLAKEFPHVRVDFYIEEGQILIGELTFFPGAGITKFEPEVYDKIVGEYLDLPVKKHFIYG